MTELKIYDKKLLKFKDQEINLNYLNCNVICNLFAVFILMQSSSLLIGMFLTGFGNVSQFIIVDSINIYLYQYILGFIILHFFYAIIIYCNYNYKIKCKTFLFDILFLFLCSPYYMVITEAKEKASKEYFI